MKNKSKRVNLFLFSILLLAGFFGVRENCLALNADHLIISEILIKADSAYEEFVEIFNPTDIDINLETLPLKLHTINSTGSTDTSKELNFILPIIKAHGFFLISSAAYQEKYKDIVKIDATYSATSSASLVPNGAIYISSSSNKNSSVIDLVCWGTSTQCLFPILSPTEKHSLEIMSDGSWQESYIIGGTPGYENFSGEDKPTVYSDKIRINELLPNPSDGEEEFVELYNFDSTEINLAGWRLEDKGGNTCSFTAATIEANEYLAIKDSTFPSGCNIALNNDGDEVSLYNPQSTSPVSSTSYSEDAQENHSYSFDGEKWQWTSFPTPGAENKLDEVEQLADDANKKTASPYDIYLNEFLPNPKGSEKENEYVELYNNEPADVDISGWILKDASKTKYVFPQNSVIGAGKYLLLQRTSFKFALNNSGNETVFLFDSFENEISKAAYSGSAKENVSYNFDGATWRWSKFLTPGAENIFNNLPTVSAKKKNKIYAGVYAEFSAKGKDADKDKLKYVWDFGDGHKSYKKETRHKYEKVGKYEVVLKVSDGSEDRTESFTVEVKKFPHSKVEIISISPNPAGKDSEAEYILIKNASKKKINLQNWSIATGSKKLYNHPIGKELVIKSGETKKIARDVSNFALNNKKAKIELRYPDGKVAAKIKYEKAGSAVAEGELYAKVDKKWRWIAAKPAAIKNSIAATPAISQENSALASAALQTTPLPPALKISEAEIKNNLGEISTIKDARENKLLSISASELPVPQNISSSSREKINFLLGIQTVRAEGDAYHFTNSHYQQPDHYAVKFAKNTGQKINSALNKLSLFLYNKP